MMISFLAANDLHAVRVIRQKGLTQIETASLCKVQGDAGEGVYQVADWAFKGRPKYGAISVCQKCSTAVTALKSTSAMIAFMASSAP